MSAHTTPSKPDSTLPDHAQPNTSNVGQELPKSVLYYGTTEALLQTERLRAGPLTLDFQNGDLRYIRWGKHELLRRLYVAVRDQNWDTIPGRIQDLRIETRSEAFAITFTMIHQQADIHFIWEGEIRGRPSGEISYNMAGQAYSGFLRNRIGICVLHPAKLAGVPCRIQHTQADQQAEAKIEEGALQGVESCFPQEISPHQPFKDIQSITHLVEEIDGQKIEAEVRFVGDVFEMEDQRNWTDASFKIYSTPLDLPFPVRIEPGDIVEQSVTIALRAESGQIPALEDAQREDDTRQEDTERIVELELAESTEGPLPCIGLGLAGHGESLSMTEIDRLRQLAPAHVRVDLYPQSRAFVGVLRDAWREAAFLGAQLEIALFLAEDAPDRVGEQLAHVARAVGEFNPDICRWLIFHQDEVSTSDRWLALARDVLTPLTPKANFITGTNAYFTELNRGDPPGANAEGVVYSVNPQVHAFDVQSLVETLEAQGTTVDSARAFGQGRAVYVSPVTLRPRFNPNATGPEPEPSPGKLPSQVDPRQMSLFGAGWTLGSVKYLSQAGAAGITYYETTGPQGVMERADGSPVPTAFRSLPGAVFPLYHVLADIGECLGAQVLPIQSLDPLAVDGMALQNVDGQTRIMLANFTADTQRVRLKGLPRGRAHLRRLDESNAIFAMTEPEQYRAAPREELSPTTQETWSNMLELELPPFGLACLDFTHGA